MADTPTGATGATGQPGITPAPGVSKSVDGALRQAIISTVVKQFTAWILKSLPVWLPLSIANPLISWIVAPLMSWLVGKLLDLTILGVNEAWIKITTDINVQAVKDASATLQNLPADATPAQVQAAQDAFDTAAGNLITIHDAPIP